MTKYSFKGILLYVLLISIPITVHAQQELVLLSDLIPTLEQQYNIRFSYIAEDIDSLKIKPLTNSQTIEDYISYLNTLPQLTVTTISDRYYSIQYVSNSNNQRCGKIIDAATGQPLENVSIAFGNAGTITNKEGYFYLNDPSIITLDISFIGYEPLRLQSNELSTSCKEIFLFPKINKLDEVLVQQVLVKGISKSIDGSTQLRTTNFGLLPGQVENDVLQIAQALPGVESVNETISTINIRGGTNDENLILWEGIRMYQVGHFFGLISAFNPNLTEEVNVYKNGTPAKYNDAVSGVIDMQSNNQIADKITGGIGVNLINAEGFIEVPIEENLEFQLSTRGSINTVLETPIYNNFSDRIFQDTEITTQEGTNEQNNILFREDFYFYDLGGKVVWKPSEKDFVSISGILIENQIDFSERLFENEETSSLEQKSIAGGISWRRDWSTSFFTQANASVSNYRLKAINEDILTQQTINQDNEILDLRSSISATKILNNRFTLEGGYQFSEIGVSNTQDVNLPRFRDFEKDVMRTHALFSEIAYRSSTKKTAIQLGIRGNYFEKIQTYRIEPRLHIYQELASGFGIETQAEMKSQTLTQRIDLQSDFLGVERRRWVLANNETVPLKTSEQLSLGFVYNKKGWFINVEGYYKHVNDILSRSQGFQNQFQFSQETGSYQIVGGEFTFNKKIKNLSLWTSYSYSKNDYDFEGFIPSEFPNNVDIRHIVNVASSFDYKNFKIAGGLQWRTGKPFTIPIAEGDLQPNNDGSFSILYDTPNNQRLTNYLRLDLSAAYTWNISENTTAKFNLALLNVLDEANSLNIRYALTNPTSADSEIQRIEELSLGFSQNFAVKLLF